MAFVLLGTPGEKLAEFHSTIDYLNESGVFIRPMPFTPVPGSKLYDLHEDYIGANKLGLEDLNEKLFPFAEMNGITLEQYQRLVKRVDVLNQRLHRRLRVNILGAQDLLSKFKVYPFFNTGLEAVCPT